MILQLLSLAGGIYFSVVYICKLIQVAIPSGRKITGYSINLYMAIISWCALYYLTH